MADLRALNSVDLNASGIQAILAAQGGMFRLGGRLSTGALFGPNEYD